MTTKLLILFLCYSLLAGSHLATAQDSPNTAINVLKRVETIAQQPAPDILKQKLKQAEEQTDLTATNLQTTALPQSEAQMDINAIRDPFTPQIPQDAKPTQPIAAISTPAIVPEQAIPVPQFIVSGMIWNSRKPAAIVNDQVVAIGDQISNWAVSQITKDGVNMTFEQQNLWIKPIVNPELGGQAQQINAYRR